MNNKTYAPFIVCFTTDNTLFQVLAELSVFSLIPVGTFFSLVQTFPKLKTPCELSL